MLKKIALGLTFALAFVTMAPSVAYAANSQNEINCLAQNIYFEAGNQPERGKIAVATTVMNRIRDGRFGNSACSVIHQRTKRTCQFSWVCTHAKVRDRKLYASVLPIAERVYNGQTNDPSNGSLFFRSTRLTCKHRYAIRIGQLVFYKV